MSSTMTRRPLLLGLALLALLALGAPPAIAKPKPKPPKRTTASILAIDKGDHDLTVIVGKSVVTAHYSGALPKNTAAGDRISYVPGKTISAIKRSGSAGTIAFTGRVTSTNKSHTVVRLANATSLDLGAVKAGKADQVGANAATGLVVGETVKATIRFSSKGKVTATAKHATKAAATDPSDDSSDDPEDDPSEDDPEDDQADDPEDDPADDPEDDDVTDEDW